jgi:hypothetical protein
MSLVMLLLLRAIGRNWAQLTFCAEISQFQKFYFRGGRILNINGGMIPTIDNNGNIGLE